MSKIITIIPTRGLLFTSHQIALENELASIEEYPSVLRSVDVPLPEARNLLIEAALVDTEWTHLLMLDDDIIMPDNSLKALLKACKKADIALIDYPHHLREVDAPRLGVAVYKNWKVGESVAGKEIAWAGLGCVLMTRLAVEKMDKPLFANTAYKFERREDGEIEMDAGTRDTLTGTAGEDTYFYLEARRQGMKVIQVPGMIAGHAHIERFIYRLGGGRYRSTHKIATNTEIDRPLV